MIVDKLICNRVTEFQDNEKDIKDRMKLMAETLAKYRLDETSDKKEEIKMSLEEAIKIIQVQAIFITRF